RHGRPHRGQPGQDAAREGSRLAGPGVHLRCRWAGRRRDPGRVLTMADLMQILTSNPIARQLGVPQPTNLRRGRELPSGPVVLATAGGSITLAREAVELLGITPGDALVDTPQTRVTETDDDGRSREVPTPYP